jgi:hypothetical protein
MINNFKFLKNKQEPVPNIPSWVTQERYRDFFLMGYWNASGGLEHPINEYSEGLSDRALINYIFGWNYYHNTRTNGDV